MTRWWVGYAWAMVGIVAMILATIAADGQLL